MTKVINYSVRASCDIIRNDIGSRRDYFLMEENM